MAQIVPDEGLNAVLDIISALPSPPLMILDTVNTTPGAGDVYTGIVPPLDTALQEQSLSGKTPSGGSGAEQDTYNPVIFGPPVIQHVETVYSWCLVLVDDLGARRLLFRRQLPVPYDCNQITNVLTITPSIGAATS